jgi:alpha-tubulin suppressor-like RCC1 family protein
MNAAHVTLRSVGVLVLGCVLLLSGCDMETVGPEAVRPEAIARLSVPGSGYTQVSAGSDHTCALRDDGVVECWGDNTYGRAPATRAASSGSFVEVAAGGLHTCALRDDGVVECWGNNGAGEAPATKSAASGVFTQVDAGTDHTCAVRSDGVIECWGNNNLGKAPATKTAASGTFTQVSAASTYSCARRDDGVVECWGNDGSGQAPPTKTAAASAFTQVSGGSLHTCARRDDGVVECWGSNSGGRAPATRTAASGEFTEVGSGVSHTCALRNDGVIECWGSNLYGQAPGAKTAAAGTFTQLSAGANHTCAVRSDGVVECWGSNTDGEAPATRTTSGGATVVLPTATFNAPSTVEEGSSADLSLADAQVPGYDGSPFVFAFDCGSGYGAFSSASQASCPTVDGPASVEVGGVVRDRDGDTREYRATLTIENVAPSIDPFPGDELLVHEAYVADGRFGDPGNDDHVATMDYGDGGGAAPLALVGTDFALDHTYDAVGSFTVEVEVTDSDGAVGMQTAVVTVLAIGDLLDLMNAEIDALKDSKVLDKGRAPKLLNELRRVAHDLQRGDVDGALASLDDFIGLVEGYVAEGVLAEEQGDAFIGEAERVGAAILAESGSA